MCTPATCAAGGGYERTYERNLLGEVTQQARLQEGWTLTRSYNRAGRLSGVSSQMGGGAAPALLSGAGYDAWGHRVREQRGNGVQVSRSYDARGRLLALGAGAYAFSVAAGGRAPDGDLVAAADSVNGDWSYGYDALNRLLTATCTAGTVACPGQAAGQNLSLSWSYDRWGNRWGQTAAAGAAPQPAFSFSGGGNRIDGGSYDAAGDLLSDGGQSFTYDVAGRITAVSGGAAPAPTTSAYDAEGRRVAQQAGSQASEFVYGLDGHAELVNAQAAPGQNLVRAAVWAGAELLASNENGVLVYPLTTPLGTLAARTDAGGAGLQSCASLPFGDGQLCSSPDNPADPAPLHFTGQPRDEETGLDFFGARNYNSSLGRWMTPDPLGGHVKNPQTLNKYVYVADNPVSLTDPTGLDFYLQCTQTEGNASTCQSRTVGYDKNGNAQTATVQGVTTDGKFTATQIGNDAHGNLVDKTTGTGMYTASVNGGGVQLSINGGDTSSAGVFVNHDANPTSTATTFKDAGWANGGNLSAFSFTFTNSKLEANQLAAGTFSFNGSPGQAEAALRSAGFTYHSLGDSWGMDEFRSPGSFWTGSDSGHFNVYKIDLDPSSSVPHTQGDMHFGEHNPFTPLGWGAHWFGEVPQ